MILKKTEYVKHIFNDKVRFENHGYQLDDEIELTFKIPSYFENCNDDPDFVKKNIRRFVKRKSVWDDDGVCIDVYLENYDTGNYGWLLRNPGETKNEKVPTEDYIVSRFDGCVVKAKYVGYNLFYIYKTKSAYTVYVSTVANSSKLIILVHDPNKRLKKKDIKGILKYETRFGFEKTEEGFKSKGGLKDENEVDFDYPVLDRFNKDVRDHNYRGNKYPNDHRDDRL